MDDASEHPEQRTTIMLWGMSGSGKSSLAPILAARVGAKCRDLDKQIEQRAGMTISAMFASEGEPAFRKRERAALEQLLEQPSAGPRVVALGGGALVNDELRARALSQTFVVMLHAPVAALLERLQGTDDRPLLRGGKEAAAKRLTDLLNARAAAYGQCHLELATEGASLQGLAAQLSAHWRPKVQLTR